METSSSAAATALTFQSERNRENMEIENFHNLTLPTEIH